MSVYALSYYLPLELVDIISYYIHRLNIQQVHYDIKYKRPWLRLRTNNNKNFSVRWIDESEKNRKYSFELLTMCMGLQRINKIKRA